MSIETKKCPKCEKTLNVSSFGKKRNGLQPFCKECNKAYHKEHYQKNKKKYIKKAAEYKFKFREEFFKKYLYGKTCKCGESRMECLEFHHRDSKNKTDNISTLLETCSIKKVEKEIEKCEIMCANCHRVETAKQYGWYSKYNLV